MSKKQHQATSWPAQETQEDVRPSPFYRTRRSDPTQPLNALYPDQGNLYQCTDELDFGWPEKSNNPDSGGGDFSWAGSGGKYSAKRRNATSVGRQAPAASTQADMRREVPVELYSDDSAVERGVCPVCQAPVALDAAQCPRCYTLFGKERDIRVAQQTRAQRAVKKAQIDCSTQHCRKCGGPLAPMMSAGGQEYCGCPACDTAAAPQSAENAQIQRAVAARTVGCQPRIAAFTLKDADVLAAKTDYAMRSRVLDELDQMIRATISGFRFDSTDQDQAYSALLYAANRAIDAYQGNTAFLSYVSAALKNEARRVWEQVKARREKEIPISEVTDPETGLGPEAVAAPVGEEEAHFEQLMAVLREHLSDRDYAIAELLAAGETAWSISKEHLLEKEKGVPNMSMRGILYSIKNKIAPAVREALEILRIRDKALTSRVQRAVRAAYPGYDPAITEVVSLDPRYRNLLRGLQEAQEGVDATKMRDVVEALKTVYNIKGSDEAIRAKLSKANIDWSESVEDIVKKLLQLGV